MNSYDMSSGAVKEHFLDTNIFNQRRCEFRIPKEVNALSNLKLVGLGAVRIAGANAPYNRGAGAVSVINRIALMDGANILSECRECNKQLAFRNINNANNVNNSYKSPQMLSATNYLYGNLSAGLGVSFKQYVGLGYVNARTQMTANEASTGKGMLVLSDVLPILNQLSMLDNAVFKNGLRIVIEWENDVRKVCTDNRNIFTVLEPVLCMYEVSNDDLYNELKLGAGVKSWYEREVDRKDFGGIPSVTVNYNGFDNKRVLKFMISKEMVTSTNYDSGDDVLGLGKCGSKALLDESFNLINNGAQVFPTAISGFNIQRQLVNAFGKCSGYQGFNASQGDSDANNFPNYSRLLQGGSARAGDLGFIGVQMNNEVIKHLELNINRDISNVGNGNNDSLSVFVFGDVAKSISISNSGAYTIGYA
jgi:hypothetical protein